MREREKERKNEREQEGKKLLKERKRDGKGEKVR